MNTPPIGKVRDAQSRRTIRHCEKWIRIFDFVTFAACLSIISSGIAYWITDSNSTKSLELGITWTGLAILIITLMISFMLSSAIAGARSDLFAGGEEGFDEHVNRLIDKRELRNEIKDRMKQ